MKKIDKAGVYDLSMADYHGQPCVGPSVSSSGLRTIFLESPADYYVTSSLNPEPEEVPESAAFALGRASHHLLLGEEAFSTLFVVRPDEIASKPWQGNRVECKAWIERQEKAGKTILKPEHIRAIRGMAKSLTAHPLVQMGILNGQVEKSLVWKDKTTGVWLKARPDTIPNDSGDAADLKTSSNFAFDLDRDVSKYRYDMQASLTGMAFREVLKREMESFSFVFVGTKPPHSVEVLTLDKTDIARAELDLRAAIETFAWCVKNNNWFGPAGTQLDARYVHISDWAKATADARRDFLRREIGRAEAVTPK